MEENDQLQLDIVAVDVGKHQGLQLTLRTGPGTVHDGVTSVQGHGVLEHFLSSLSSLVSGVDKPSIGLHQNGGSKVLLLVPPVRRTRGAATCTQNTFVKTVKLLSILNTLEVLLTVSWLGLGLQIRLDGLVLLVEMRKVRNQVSHNVHVRKRIYLEFFGFILVDLAKTSQCVLSANIHGTRPTNTFSATSSESERGVLFVFDLDDGVKDHRTALVQIDLVFLHVRLLVWGVRGPSVNLERLESLGGGLGGHATSSLKTNDGFKHG